MPLNNAKENVREIDAQGLQKNRAMEFTEDIKDRQFQLMLKPAQERLKKYTPAELCEKGRLLYDEETREFRIWSIDHEIAVRYPDFVIQEDLEMWHYLTLLQYMDTADGTPLTGKKIGLSQMRGGLARGRSYEKHISTMFLYDVDGITPEQFEKVCVELGGKILPSRADVTAEFYYAPCFPITANFWAADEEEPTSVKVLLDESAEHYLTIEAAGAACLTVMEEIHKRLISG